MSKNSSRAYYLRNREYIIKRNREYKDNNIELRFRDIKSHLRYILGKARSRKKKEFDLIPENLYELWEIQNGLCAYSKVPLNNIANHLHTASLDRIDSKIGYIKGNIQLVCSAVNRMKQEFSEKDFLNFCELITNEKRKITQNIDLSKIDPQ